jgi:hypothetical protein
MGDCVGNAKRVVLVDAVCFVYIGEAAGRYGWPFGPDVQK